MDDGAPLPSREDEVADEAFRSVFPNGLPPARPAAVSAIVRTFPLAEEHLAKMAVAADEGKTLGVETPSLQQLSRTHHRAAQLLAMGMDEGRVAVVCNYSVARISILKSDPLFMELLQYYGAQVEDEFQSVAAKMADLHEDVVDEIRRRLEDNPGQFSIGALSDLMMRLADRTGHGPTQNHNVRQMSVTLNGDDLARIKSTPAAQPQRVDGQVRQLTEEDRRALGRVFAFSANDAASPISPEGERQGERVGVREEDSCPPQAPPPGA